MTIWRGLLAISLVSPSEAYGRYPISPEPPIICPCQYKYNPVCGSDGVTYMNKCVMDYTSEMMAKRGQPTISMVQDCQCTDSCVCQDVDLPVCTLDGQTFPNECELACENTRRIANQQDIILLAYRAACRGVSGSCSDITFPVCGSDNVVYRNRCVLDYANYVAESKDSIVTVKNNGECQDSFLCPITKQPVCANDGKMYDNLCDMEAENERRKCQEETIYLREADPSTCNACYCTIENDPVCASDRYTYPNQCQLDCAMKYNRTLKALHKGICRECECEEDKQPICGTDRKTYGNRCLMECESIRYKEPLRVFHEGKCQEFECDCSYCDESAYQPVCGDDGNTYWNLCWLRCNDR